MCVGGVFPAPIAYNYMYQYLVCIAYVPVQICRGSSIATFFTLRYSPSVYG